MRFKSTRGLSPSVKFEEAIIEGLADDGGLYVPEMFPRMDVIDLLENAYTFQEVFFKISRLFISESDIPSIDLQRIIMKSFETFRSRSVVEVVKVDKLLILELFHGPTFAFKDVALQFLGNLFEYFLSRRERIGKGVTHMTIIGATSGDTGSAAIYGLKGKKNINVYIMFPYKRVTEIQERQMTTVMDSNVHNLSIKGTFDDCQAIVKSLFNDLDFKRKMNLGAVNSINMARIIAQISYYVYGYIVAVKKHYITADLKEKNLPQVTFSVPTGNSGDILAGFYAKLMGLPISKLFLCTNRNNTLHQFFSTGVYAKSPEVLKTYSPSMDIVIASNFERFLYFLSDNNSELLRTWMKSFESNGKLVLASEYLNKARQYIVSAEVSDQETLDTISQFYKFGYTLCPHTAVGVKGALKIQSEINNNDKCFCLATAHNAKFRDAVKLALGKDIPIPTELNKLFSLPTKMEIIEADRETIKQYIVSHNPQKSKL
jgi:threonine synthase